jgi:death-on-curing family protein
MEETKKGEIIIYKAAEGPELKVTLEGETVWLTQSQIAGLFQTDRTSIGRHIKNILNSAELRENSVCAIFAHTALDGKTYKVQYYNLDMIISVGYRVNSKKATVFRQWATNKLKELMLKGYAVYENRFLQLKEQHNFQLKELRQTTQLFYQALESNRAGGYEKGLLNIILDYANAWTILHEYDEGKLELGGIGKKASRPLEHKEIKISIERFKKRLMDKKQASNLFGQEVGNKLDAVLSSIHQTYNSKELYPSLEEKAAHLFYFAIKDHPFVDGNKRIASLLFLLFLVENNQLMNRKGERKVNDTALVALALLVAESAPKQKEIMVRLIVNLIKR